MNLGRLLLPLTKKSADSFWQQCESQGELLLVSNVNSDHPGPVFLGRHSPFCKGRRAVSSCGMDQVHSTGPAPSAIGSAVLQRPYIIRPLLAVPWEPVDVLEDHPMPLICAEEQTDPGSTVSVHNSSRNFRPSMHPPAGLVRVPFMSLSRKANAAPLKGRERLVVRRYVLTNGRHRD